MSKIANKGVKLQEKVSVEITQEELLIKGPKGEKSLRIPERVQVENKEGDISFLFDNKSKESRKDAGTFSSHIRNWVKGLTDGHECAIDLVGVGYKVQVKGKSLSFNLGYSHPIEYDLPEEVTAKSSIQTKFTLESSDKELLGQTAAEIRSFRKPEPYKGKGIKFVDEVIIRKAGKSAK
jgi:large subunit ribosomal protein L6